MVGSTGATEADMKTLKSMATKWIGGALLGALLIGSGLAGCGGAPARPPEDGECRPWREWVPPHQDDSGDWHTGYCQDRRD